MLQRVRRWWKERGVRLCAEGKHKWKDVPPRDMQDFFLMLGGATGAAQCARCGCRGYKISFD